MSSYQSTGLCAEPKLTDPGDSLPNLQLLGPITHPVQCRKTQDAAHSRIRAGVQTSEHKSASHSQNGSHAAAGRRTLTVSKQRLHSNDAKGHLLVKPLIP